LHKNYRKAFEKIKIFTARKDSFYNFILFCLKLYEKSVELHAEKVCDCSIFLPPVYPILILMILIVDDSRKAREMIRSIIEDLDGDFYECADGSEALDAYTRCQPSWVFMDMAMRGMNGLDATRQIIAAYPQAHIAIVTSYDDNNLRLAAKEAGASKYFIKENLFELRGLFAA
jgi:CheY-like chemotaxis protein